MIFLTGSGGAFDAGFFLLIVAIVAVFLFFFIVLFLRKRTIPMIRLMFIRIFIGKFSYPYLEFFKKNDLRNPLTNCIRDEITLHFSFFFKQLSNATCYRSELPINEFKDIPFLVTYKQIVKQLGTPHCINIARFHQQRVKVVGYTESYQQRKMKSLFYFIEERFVMGEFVFSETHRVDPTSIREALTEKYLAGSVISSDTFYIEGADGNILNYHDNGFFASVKYLCRSDHQINATLSAVFPGGEKEEQTFRKAMIQEELINRF